MRGNYLAPLASPATILDVGCGTGRWAMEMAQQFPQARVIAGDIAPPTPGESLGHGVAVIPPNVEFHVFDATHPLPFADGSFDFIYIRLLYSVLPAPAWEPLIRELARICRPGGWIESLEALPFPSSHRAGMATIIDWFSAVLRHRGADPLVALKIPGFFHAIGLQHVTKRKINQAQTLPEQTEQRRTSSHYLIDNLRAPALQYHITTEEEYDRVAQQARQELDTGVQLSGFNTYVTYGQRPMARR